MPKDSGRKMYTSSSQPKNIFGVRLTSVVSLLVLFSFVNFFYFYTQSRLEHVQVALVIQSFESDLNNLQDRQKRSLAHITERFNELRTQVIGMEMEYDSMNDKIKQVKDVSERHGDESNSRVDSIAKKVSGIGVLLGRMPSLLQKVEAENRDSVETVNTKLSKLETLLGNPSLKNFLNSPIEKSSSKASNTIKLGDSFNPFAGSNAISNHDTDNSNNINIRNVKKNENNESPSDLPQKPRVDDDEDVSAEAAKIIMNTQNSDLPGSLSMRSSTKSKDLPQPIGAQKVDSDAENDHVDCELDLEWQEGPSSLDTYDNFMAAGEHWLEKEDFTKAIPCFNAAEKKKSTQNSVSSVGSDGVAQREKKKANVLRILAEKSMNSKKLGGGGALILELSAKTNIGGTQNLSDRPENDNSNADMPQAVHKREGEND